MVFISMKQSIDDVEIKQKCAEFLERKLLPFAKKFDDEQCIPRSFLYDLAASGYLGATIPEEFNGQNLNYLSLGYIHEAFGTVLASAENILTVFGMVTRSLNRFGSKEQRKYWLPRIANGETVVAIALSEPGGGSDLKSIKTYAEEKQDHFCLNGRKKYITLGQIADLFLVLVRLENSFIVLLIEKNTQGLSIFPQKDFLGLRSNLLAEIEFTNCKIPKENLLGVKASGLSQVVACALDEGRYTTAWGCVGVAQACLTMADQYSNTRQQFDSLLSEHQLIQKKLTEMIAQTKAARALCMHVGNLREQVDMSYIAETLVAKYFSANMVVDVAKHALSIFGATGFTKDHAIERFYRDAHMMQVIEGTAEMYEMMIPQMGYGF